MTREEAIEILSNTSFFGRSTDDIDTALDMAISALSENKGDLISREKLKDYLDRNISFGGVEKKFAFFDIIDSIPSAENKGEWIPVTERLPDNNVIVLCSAISTSISGGYTRFVGCCSNGFWFVQTDAETVSYPRQYEVIAWQPLPEPYKESEVINGSQEI